MSEDQLSDDSLSDKGSEDEITSAAPPPAGDLQTLSPIPPASGVTSEPESQESIQRDVSIILYKSRRSRVDALASKLIDLK